MTRVAVTALGILGAALLVARASEALPPNVPSGAAVNLPPVPWATWTTSYAFQQGIGVYTGSSYPVAYLNQRFIVSGMAAGASTTTLSASTDGSTWSGFATIRLAGVANNQMAADTLGFANGKYIAGFRNGAIEVSPDGVTWTSASYTLKQPLFSIACGASNCVMGTTGVVLTSTDATMLNWKIATLPNQTNGVMGLAYGNGLYVAVTETGSLGSGANTGGIYTSPDGVNWSTAVATTGGLFSVAFGNQGFIAVGWNGASYSSPDGVTWSGPTTIGPGTLTGIAYGDGVYVAVGYAGNGTAPLLYTTQTGTTAWTARTIPIPAGAPPILSTVAFGNNRFVAYAMGGLAYTSAVLPTVPTPVVVARPVSTSLQTLQAR